MEVHGHSAVLYEEKIVVFGGERDYTDEGIVWEFDLATHEWTQINTVGAFPAARAFHTATTWREYMFVFGGLPLDLKRMPIERRAVKSLNHPGLYNALWKYHVDMHEWHAPSCVGDPPAPRYHHSASLYRDNIYVYGGLLTYSDDNHVDSELHYVFELSPATSVWRRVECKQSLLLTFSLWGHTVAQCGQYMVIFGGMMHLYDNKIDGSPPPSSTFTTKRDTLNDSASVQLASNPSNNIYLWNCEKNLWVFVDTSYAPLARTTHVAVAKGHCIYIHGGHIAGKKPTVFNDCFMFDMDIGQWHAPNEDPSSQKAPRLWNHSAVMHGNCMYLYGGISGNGKSSKAMWVFNSGRGSWYTIQYNKQVKYISSASARGLPLLPDPGPIPPLMGSSSPHMSTARSPLSSSSPPSSMFTPPPPPPPLLQPQPPLATTLDNSTAVVIHTTTSPRTPRPQSPPYKHTTQHYQHHQQPPQRSTSVGSNSSSPFPVGATYGSRQEDLSIHLPPPPPPPTTAGATTGGAPHHITHHPSNAYIHVDLMRQSLAGMIDEILIPTLSEGGRRSGGPIGTNKGGTRVVNIVGSPPQSPHGTSNPQRSQFPSPPPKCIPVHQSQGIDHDGLPQYRPPRPTPSSPRRRHSTPPTMQPPLSSPPPPHSLYNNNERDYNPSLYTSMEMQSPNHFGPPNRFPSSQHQHEPQPQPSSHPHPHSHQSPPDSRMTELMSLQSLLNQLAGHVDTLIHEGHHNPQHHPPPHQHHAPPPHHPPPPPHHAPPPPPPHPGVQHPQYNNNSPHTLPPQGHQHHHPPPQHHAPPPPHPNGHHQQYDSNNISPPHSHSASSPPHSQHRAPVKNSWKEVLFNDGPPPPTASGGGIMILHSPSQTSSSSSSGGGFSSMSSGGRGGGGRSSPTDNTTNPALTSRDTTTSFTRSSSRNISPTLKSTTTTTLTQRRRSASPSPSPPRQQHPRVHLQPPPPRVAPPSPSTGPNGEYKLQPSYESGPTSAYLLKKPEVWSFTEPPRPASPPSSPPRAHLVPSEQEMYTQNPFQY